MAFQGVDYPADVTGFLAAGGILIWSMTGHTIALSV